MQAWKKITAETLIMMKRDPGVTQQILIPDLITVTSQSVKVRICIQIFTPFWKMCSRLWSYSHTFNFNWWFVPNLRLVQFLVKLVKFFNSNHKDIKRLPKQLYKWFLLRQKNGIKICSYILILELNQMMVTNAKVNKTW